MPDKPRHRSGYSVEETELVRSACLTVAVTLGAYLDDLVIVGGLVPTLLIDLQRDAGADRHPGTNDLDIGLSLAVLDEQRYASISARLRAEGFQPDENDSGNVTVQRWRLGSLTVDFLIPPTTDQTPNRRIRNVEADFGAVVTPGLGLAFVERSMVRLEGTTLAGEHVTREVPVCGPGAFVVLKALAFGDRAEPKDAFDLVYVLRHFPGGAAAVADQLREHATRQVDVVLQAVQVLMRDFATFDDLGPQRAAEFEHLGPGNEHDAAAADAHGFVDDLLRRLDHPFEPSEEGAQ